MLLLLLTMNICFVITVKYVEGIIFQMFVFSFFMFVYNRIINVNIISILYGVHYTVLRRCEFKIKLNRFNFEK